MQNEIARSAYEYQRKIEANEKIIVGVNKFTIDEHDKIPLFKIDDNIRKFQIEKLKQIKTDRDNALVTTRLRTLSDKAISGENLMPAVIDAVEDCCTLGEIADELRKVFGEYK